jgi:hypothetical protein
MGTGCCANDPINKMRLREHLACFVLQQGEPVVVTWIPEL